MRGDELPSHQPITCKMHLTEDRLKRRVLVVIACGTERENNLHRAPGPTENAMLVLATGLMEWNAQDE